MKPWSVLITDGLEESGLRILEAEARPEVRNGILAPELSQVIRNYDALIVRGRTQVSAELLEAAHELKVVGRAGVGVDNIDLQAAKKRSIVVVNSPYATSSAVAELVIGLLFGLAREFPRADQALKNGIWLKNELLGIEITGKKLGIIGMGHIGSEVARKAATLGMTVCGYDPNLNEAEISRRGAQPLPLTELYATSDFITLHVPLTDETRGMISSQVLRRMKPGVRLICAARGGIIDEDALRAALETGKVAGAALDVFEQEPPGVSPLITHPNVIATPHIGAQTQESQIRAAQDIAQEVLFALKGEPLRWRIV